MTRNSSTSRKIKKRKTNKDTNLSTDSPKNATPKSATPNTTPLTSRKQYFQKSTQPSLKLSTKEPAHTKPRTNLSERKLQNLTIDTILTPKRIRSSYFKKNKPNLILIYILSIMFITLLLTPNITYNLQTSKTFSIHNTSTSLSHLHPTSTT